MGSRPDITELGLTKADQGDDYDAHICTRSA
ncbi:MAG: hypothetical protein JWO59_2832 [Chloroflexi bacterium]|nr:hypothetical protein [Chloroflexota bacterium]